MKTGDLSNASESFKKRNPHLYGLGGLEAGQPEPASIQTLAGKPSEHEQSEGCVEVCITFITLRARQLDSDNNVASIKPLRDAVCDSLGVDDADPRLTFNYHQIKTSGREGVIVHLETTYENR